MVGEEDTLSPSNLISQGNVIEEEFVMGGSEFGCELCFNVISVIEQFFSTMREGERDGSGCPSSSG